MSKGYVVIVGGVAMDLKARSRAGIVLGTSNPGELTRSPGGVARNVAENLARLGSEVRLVGVVGDDPLGAEVLARTAAAGVDVSAVRQDGATGTYTALLDADGELVVAVADLAATEALTPASLPAGLLRGAAIVVLDTNLPPEVLGAALDLLTASPARVVIDPVSVPKAGRLTTLLTPERTVFALTPNLAELSALTGTPLTEAAEAPAAARTLTELGVEHVWVRLGAAGSVLCSADGTVVPVPPVPAEPVDVTGAGDAMLAGFCHALLSDEPPSRAAAYGQAVAALTVESVATVRPDLCHALVAHTLERTR